MAAQQRAAYRSILREIQKASIQPRGQRNRDIAQNIRSLFETHKSPTEAQVKKLQGVVGNAVVFLRAQRTYKELLDRYNPLHDMTQEDRVKATARRVGLDMPVKGAKKDEE